jgi:tripartite-type tricarboxylate transporter receptor subunit TctC
MEQQTLSLSRVGYVLDMQTSSCRSDWVQEVLNSYSNDPDMQQMMQQLAIQSPDEKGFSLEQSLVKFKGRLVIGNNFAL